MSSSAGVPCTLLLHRTRSRALSYAVRARTGNHAGGGMAVTAGRRDAFRFVVVMGTVSLFADFTYEGARSITGPFLATLGASATMVGMVAGLGELAGYA